MTGLANQYNAINLSQGFPNFEPAQQLKDLVAQCINENTNQYAPMAGLPVLREQIANKEMIMPNMVITEKTMASVAEKLPATLKALGGIKGVGAQKAAQYGPELIMMIRAYQLELNGKPTDQASLF